MSCRVVSCSVVVVVVVVVAIVVVVVVYLSIYLSVCLSASLKTQQFCETSSVFELDNAKNAAILRDFLVDDIKNEAIVRDHHQKWKIENKGDGLVPMRLAIFPFRLFKVLRPKVVRT